MAFNAWRRQARFWGRIVEDAVSNIENWLMFCVLEHWYCVCYPPPALASSDDESVSGTTRVVSDDESEPLVSDDEPSSEPLSFCAEAPKECWNPV